MNHDGMPDDSEPGSDGSTPEEVEAKAPKPPPDRFIILLRHGVAEPRLEGLPDEARRLSKAGANRMREIGWGMAKLFPRARVICTSPLTRAVQTGARLAKGYGGKVKVRTLEALAPGQDAMAFLEALDAMPERHAIFVGHEPGLTQLLGELCSLDTTGLSLKKGGCYGLRIQASGHTQLEWMLSPKVLRRIEG